MTDTATLRAQRRWVTREIGLIKEDLRACMELERELEEVSRGE